MSTPQKIYGRLITRWGDMKKYPSEPKIFVTKRFSLADCQFLPKLAGVITEEPIGSTAPAVLPLVNSGVPYFSVTPIIFSAAGVRMNNHLCRPGDTFWIDPKQRRVGFAPARKKLVGSNLRAVAKPWPPHQRRQFFCFINNLHQLPEVKRRGSAVAIRSEDLFVHNYQTVRSMRNFLKTGSALALREWTDSQGRDWFDLFNYLKDRPIMIRLLDTALSEFFPRERRWREKNMQLGNRGVRLFFTEPKLYQAHLRAIIIAARESCYQGEILLALPFVSLLAELKAVRTFLFSEIKSLKAKDLRWKFGFTLETPRVFFSLPDVVKTVDFFNMGLNDFTQLMFGFSRDDTPLFVPRYIKKHVLPADPFVIHDSLLVKLVCQGLARVSPRVTINIPVANSDRWRFWRRKLPQKNIRYLCNFNFH